METIGSIIVPFFGIMVIGYLAGRFRLLPAGSSEVLTRFVFYIAMPALIFVSISKVPVSEFFNWSYLGVLGGGMLAMFAMGMLVAHFVFPDNFTANTLHGLTAMYSSTAYIGLPLLLTMFNDAAMAPGIIGAVITGTVFTPIAIILAESDRDSARNDQRWKPVVAALTRPPILATAAGLLLSGLGATVPVPVAALCEVLGGAFVPCALFSAGLFIAGCSTRGAGAEIGWLVFAKLIIHPLITWWLAYRVFELEGILPAIAVIQAALPCGVPVFVLAQQYDTFVIRSSAAIVWSTAISVLSLSLLLLILDI